MIINPKDGQLMAFTGTGDTSISMLRSVEELNLHVLIVGASNFNRPMVSGSTVLLHYRVHSLGLIKILRFKKLIPSIVQLHMSCGIQRRGDETDFY